MLFCFTVIWLTLMRSFDLKSGIKIDFVLLSKRHWTIRSLHFYKVIRILNEQIIRLVSFVSLTPQNLA